MMSESIDGQVREPDGLVADVHRATANSTAGSPGR
jgi:hypothetical protein